MPIYNKSEAQDWANQTLRGQWSTLVTPFTPDNKIDEIGLRSNIRHIRSLGATGAGCTWGMGEFWSLTYKERTNVYEIVADEAAGTWNIGAHVTHTSVSDMLALADSAEATGFDLLIVAPPYFVTKTELQVLEFVRILANHSSLAIMFYNSPQFGIVMSAQGLKEICEIENVVGVKEASFDRQLTVETHQLIGNTAIISAPDEWVLFKGRELGFQQQVMFANTSDWRFDEIGSNHYVQFIDHATAGNIDDQLYQEHIQPLKTLSDQWWQRTMQKQHGALPVPMVKYWGELMGMASGGVRPPLIDMPDKEKQELKSNLESIRNKGG